MRIITMLLATIFTVSCGIDNTIHATFKKKDSTSATVTVSSTPSATTTLTAATAADLPTCDTTNQNQLVYLKDVKEFRSCDNGTWDAIAINGTNGKDGANGINGVNGVTGKVIDSVWGYTFNEDAYTTESSSSSPAIVYNNLLGDIMVHKVTNARWVKYTDTSSDVSVALFNVNGGWTEHPIETHFKASTSDQTDIIRSDFTTAVIRIKINNTTGKLNLDMYPYNGTPTADTEIPLTQLLSI